jgi:hypothetical protein
MLCHDNNNPSQANKMYVADSLLLIVPKKPGANGAFQIIDASRCFLLITSGEALVSVQDSN